MTSRLSIIGVCAGLALVAGCASVSVEPPVRADLAAAVVRSPDGRAPAGPEGACWAQDTLPAVIETVTEQVMADPAVVGADGAVTRPARYRTVTHQRMVSDRREIWFRAPCPSDVTPDFVATLQRALKARGYYRGALSGRMDTQTAAAVRRFQTSRGLDSARLSLAAAQELGVATTALGELEERDGSRSSPDTRRSATAGATPR